MTGEICEHCAEAPARGPGAWLAHHACQDRTCACARNNHRRDTLATQAHDDAIRIVQNDNNDQEDE